jgi:hypothetical protein
MPARLITTCSDDDLNEFAWSSELGQCVFHGHSRIGPAASISGGDIVNLSLAWKQDHERLVVAKSGIRLTLKESVIICSAKMNCTTDLNPAPSPS